MYRSGLTHRLAASVSIGGGDGNSRSCGRTLLSSGAGGVVPSCNQYFNRQSSVRHMLEESRGMGCITSPISCAWTDAISSSLQNLELQRPPSTRLCPLFFVEMMDSKDHPEQQVVPTTRLSSCWSSYKHGQHNIKQLSRGTIA